MEIIFNQNTSPSPIISIILLDWSIRESFHILYYLSDQTIPREQYEVIWIEYYNKHAHELEAGIEEGKKLGIPPIVDKWIVMDMPRNIYYHKHLMYNIGTLVTRGKIVTFCDSDAIVKPTFIENIIKSFDEDPNIVLHMDEARNNDKRFYPFNYPSVEEVIGEGVINWKDGKTTGLFDRVDPLHTRNYGACMSALREDLINIGGADEHIDYLGHICGPYEMTFRLVNAGKGEVWHQEEFLYHVWHPGQAGQGNYLGPHDGKYMSTTALRTLKTGRILPLVENPAIKKFRLKEDKIGPEQIFYPAIPEEVNNNWDIERLEKRNKALLNTLWGIMRKLSWEPIRMGNIFFNKPGVVLGIADTLLKMFCSGLLEEKKPFKKVLQEVFRKYLLLTDKNKYNEYALNRCKILLEKLVRADIHEVALYGTDDVAGIFHNLITHSPVKIKAVYDDSGDKRWLGFDIISLEGIKGFYGHVVVPNLVGAEKKVELLKGMGLKQEQIIIM